MIEAALRAHLAATAAVSALVGSRIYPLILPQAASQPPSTVPALTYQRITGLEDQTQTGPSGLERIRLQVDAWAATYAQAKTLAGAVRSAFRFLGGVVSGELVLAVLFDTDRDIYEPDTKLYRVSADYFVWFAEL